MVGVGFGWKGVSLGVRSGFVMGVLLISLCGVGCILMIKLWDLGFFIWFGIWVVWRFFS